jgi:hypothetical protein
MWMTNTGQYSKVGSRVIRRFGYEIFVFCFFLEGGEVFRGNRADFLLNFFSLGQ